MNESTAPAAESSPRSRVPVVGIGASAGGIKALKQFFACVPPDSGIAWVVILHLSPDHDSKLAEVLQTTAPMPVTQVQDRVAVERNHVYVVPPNKSLDIRGHELIVSEMTRAEQRRSPVDVFFRALADAHGSNAVAIVLSGTGPNGSAGLKRIKEYGGLALAQDPEEADYADMPRNSIATGLVDLVLPVAEMPGRIITYFKRAAHPEPIGDRGAADDDSLKDLLSLLRVRTGHDFSNYKMATVQRRIARRIQVRDLPNVAEYARFVRQNPEEAVALMKELLISVTNFFRDPEAWQLLDERIVPRLFADKRAPDQIRAWVPGCATGEEAYSIAMLLAEHSAGQIDGPAIQVFGTDLDEQAIALARQGFYSDADVVDIPEARLHRFFKKTIGGYHVRRELREMLLFAHHNVIKDPPFSHIDLISCRNLLIYLNRIVQERVIETFHFALRPGGFLFIGSSESPDSARGLFVRVDGAPYVYESRLGASRVAIPLGATSTPSIPAAQPADVRRERISPADLHQRLLEHYAPPSLVVTEDYNLVHTSGSAARFLQVPAGEPTRDVLRLVVPDLRAELRTALHQSLRTRTAVEARGVPIRLNEHQTTVDLTVRPTLRDGEPPQGYLVVLLNEASASVAVPAATPARPPERIDHQLEDELSHVKEQLRLTIEQYETQAEDARASNEELQAMNEELRSSAEELETSKEELQSLNEELTTVNQELKIKIEELKLTNNDFQNLINSTDIGTIFLDRAFRVKFFTPRALDIFNLVPADTGRPLANFTSRLTDDAIHRDVRSVLENLQTIERETETIDGRWHLTRVLPYRTTENRIDGVVLTFQDITARRDAEQRVRVSEERLRLLIDSAIDYAIVTLTDDGKIDSWNAGANRMFGYSSDEIIGQSIDTLFTTADQVADVPARHLAEARAAGRAIGERLYARKDGAQFVASVVTTRLGSGELGFATIARDLTPQRRAAEALIDAREENETRIKTRTQELEVEKGTVTQLLRRIVSAQEDERARIARDLHDSLGQPLTALRLALERHQQTASGDAIVQALELTTALSEQVDFLAWDLRPAVLDDLGLAAALPRFVDAWSAHVGIPANFRNEGFVSGQLDHDTEVAFYRIAQEALNNVAKHAHASRADVVITATSGVVMVIEDDGAGFDAADAAKAAGIGLASMRERAALVDASLDIESEAGRGTCVYLRAPFNSATSKDSK